MGAVVLDITDYAPLIGLLSIFNGFLYLSF